MKKVAIALSICFLGLQFTACKSETKKEETKDNTPTKVEQTAPFSFKNAENSINFTAYKTTEKVPVKGVFKKVEVLKGGEGNSVKEAVNGAEFKIPVGSIETKDTSRNFKIKKFFFGVMENTISLTGKLNIETDSTGVAEFTMNSVSQKLPFKYTIAGKVFKMNATMNILDWNAKNAVDSLNAACKDLHKGPDGVSKTWSEVAIDVMTTFK